jgi:hypothetical protein
MTTAAKELWNKRMENEATMFEVAVAIDAAEELVFAGAPEKEIQRFKCVTGHVSLWSP